jgi:hypothetical protein
MRTALKMRGSDAPRSLAASRRIFLKDASLLVARLGLGQRRPENIKASQRDLFIDLFERPKNTVASFAALSITVNSL